MAIYSNREIRPFWITAFGILVLSGCASTSSGPTYPVLETEQVSDAYLTCSSIAGDFRGASDLRAEIIETHGDAISGAIKDSAWGVLTNPSGALSKGVWTAAGVSAKAAEYATAAAAAGQRMEQLLRYKREKDCLPLQTRDPSLTDDEILTLLDDLRAKLDAEQIEDKEYVEQRANLLSKMHDLNY